MQSTTLTLLLASVVWSANSHGQEAGCREPAQAPSETEDSSAGLRAYIDPVTGELTDPPPDSLPPGNVTAGDSANAPNVFPESVSPDGTVSIDLGDRFITPLHAEVIDGKIVTCHRPAPETEQTDSETEFNSDGVSDEKR